MGGAAAILIALCLIARPLTALKLDQGAPPQSKEELTAFIAKSLADPAQRLSTVADALEALPSAPKAAGLCEKAESGRGRSQGFSEVAAASFIAASQRCLDGNQAKRWHTALWEAVPEHPTIADYAAALRAVVAVGKQHAKSISESEISRLSKLLEDATASSGKVRNRSGLAVSIQATGLAYRIAGYLQALGLKLTPSGEAALSNLKSQAPKVLEQVLQNGWTVAGDSSGLTAMTLFLEGLKDIGIGSTELSKSPNLAASLAGYSATGSLESAAFLLRTLTAFEAAGAQLVFFQLETPSVSLSSQAEVIVLAKDQNSKPVDLSLRAKITDSAKSVLADDVSLSGSKGQYRLDLKKLKPSPGLLRLDLTGSSSRGEVSSSLSVAVTSPVKYGSASLAFEKEDGSVIAEESADFPATISVGDVQSASIISVTLAASDSLAKAPPALRLSCSDSGEAVVLAFEKSASGSSSSSSSLVVRQSLAAVFSHLQGECGTLEATVFHVDPYSEAEDWRLATINSNFQGGGGTSPALPHASFAPKPVIRHQFRVPDRRPPRLLSVLFAAAAFLPLLGLVYALSQLGVNLKGFPSAGTGRTAAFAFHGGLVGLVLLYAAFWLRLDLLTTLAPLAGLSILLVVSGYYLLSHLSALRLKQA